MSHQRPRSLPLQREPCMAGAATIVFSSALARSYASRSAPPKALTTPSPGPSLLLPSPSTRGSMTGLSSPGGTEWGLTSPEAVSTSVGSREGAPGPAPGPAHWSPAQPPPPPTPPPRPRHAASDSSSTAGDADADGDADDESVLSRVERELLAAQQREAQADKDELRALRDSYLPRVLVEAEAEAAAAEERAEARARRRGTQACEALMLRGGVLPKRLSPWRRSLAAALRSRAPSPSLEGPSGVSLPYELAVGHVTVHAAKAATNAARSVDPALIKEPTLKALYRRGGRGGRGGRGQQRSVTPGASTDTPPIERINELAEQALATILETASLKTLLPSRASSAATPQLRGYCAGLRGLLGGSNASSDFLSDDYDDQDAAPAPPCIGVLEPRREANTAREWCGARRWRSLVAQARVARRNEEAQRRRRVRQGGAGVVSTTPFGAPASRPCKPPAGPLSHTLFARKEFFGGPGPNCNTMPWIL